MTAVLPSHVSEGRTRPTRPPLVSSRPAWVGAFLLTAAATLGRLPALGPFARHKLLESGQATSLTNPMLRNVAVNTGLWLAIAFSLAVVAIYYSLASVMERHLLPVSRGVPRFRVGMLYCVAVLSTLPVHVWCALTGTISVRGSAYYVSYLVVVAVICPLGFLASVKRLNAARLLTVWLLCLAVAMLSYVI